MDLRYTEVDERRDLELYRDDYDRTLALSAIPPDTPSDRTVFSDRDCRITMVEKQTEIQLELGLLPKQPRGRPKAGEIRDATQIEDKKWLTRELKNVTKRVEGLLAINALAKLSGANPLTVISPLHPKFGAYIHIGNPDSLAGKVHGDLKTPIKMLLTTPTHVEVFTGETLGFVTSSTEIIKLNEQDMTAKYDELKTDRTLITYPSSTSNFANRWDVYALETPFNLWCDEKWTPQSKTAVINSSKYSGDIICTSMIPQGEAETNEVKLHGDDVELRQRKPRIVNEAIINVDQSKAYSRAFDTCMTSFLAKPGCCMGKISEVFSLVSHADMTDMLSQKSKVFWRLTRSPKIIEYLLSVTPDLDFTFVTAEKIIETLCTVYTIEVAPSYTVDHYTGIESSRAPKVPKVLTFAEARFWLKCGVTFDGLVAMISYESIPIAWDDSSHEKDNHIRYYAKAVGVGMSTNLTSRFHLRGSELQAHEYFALAQEDINLDESRVHIRRLVGEREVDLAPLQAYTSVALEYARELSLTCGGEVEWKCTKTIRGTGLVNGSRFKADMHVPIYEGVDLTPHIGAGITFSPTSTIHSCQGITFEGDTLYLDQNMVWDVKMLPTRDRENEQGPRYIGEGLLHRTEKARQFGLARSAGHCAIEESPGGDGRYIADLAVVEVVVTSPPSREKLAYYQEQGIECGIIISPKATVKATV
ncbi:hypothetical protein T492DRAFT_1152004 [Pavlovales sp. CCMP2436]|nr:hypothetical protein T492DRAFT_1152004 [Pavlovales sp. CCMP2436]